MNSVNSLLNFFFQLKPEEAAFWLLVQNMLQFVMCLVAGHMVWMLCRQRRIVEPPLPITGNQVFLSLTCILLNTVVAVAGWFLWKQGVIKIKQDLGITVIVDMAVLLVMMDFLMYASHRIAHLPILFRLVHATHHLEEHPRPLSLFVLSPMEVFGYGALWLVVLSVYSSSWLGIVLYLLLNASFGTIGHLGVEPFPKGWLSIPVLGHLTTSTFHAQHHLNGNKNFGFYTDVWDKLFGTLSDNYKQLFVESSSRT